MSSAEKLHYVGFVFTLWILSFAVCRFWARHFENWGKK